MVKQRLNMLREANGVLHLQVFLERCLVDPAGMNVEQPPITGRTIGLVCNTAEVTLRSSNFLPEQRGHHIFLAFLCVEPSEDG